MATSTETKIIEIKIPIGEGIKQIQLLTAEIEKLRGAQAALKKGTDAEKEQYEKNAIAIKEYTRQKAVLQREVQTEIKSVQSAMGAYDKLQLAYTKAQAKAKDLAASNTATGKEIKKAATEANNLNDKLKGIDRTVGQSQRGVGEYERGLGGISKRFMSFIGVSAIIAGIGAAFKNAFGIVKEFDQAMANVNAITNASKEELKQLRDIAIALGGSTKFTASEIAGLETELGKLGFTTQQIIVATKGITLAAAATGESLQATAMIVGSTTMAFGLNASETQRVADVMAKSFSTSALDLSNFAESIKYVAPIAKQAGVSVEETAALLGVLANNGIKGSMAGTSLRKVFTDLIGTGGSLQDKIKELTKGGLNLADAKDEVGRTAMTTLMILKDNIETIPGLTKVYNEAAGAAQDMADKQLNTIQGRITILKSTWEGFILSIENGQGRFSIAIKDMLVGLTNTISGFKKLLMSDSDAKDDTQRNVVNNRITDFEKYLSQEKDKAKYINAEIVAEKELVKTKTERAAQLENEIKWRANLGGAWDDSNKQRIAEVEGLKTAISQSNSYINALGGIRKAKADEVALSMQVASTVAENQNQSIDLTKEQITQLEKLERQSLLTDMKLEELFAKMAADNLKKVKQFEDELLKASQIGKKLLEETLNEEATSGDIEVEKLNKSIEQRKINQSEFLQNQLDATIEGSNAELNAKLAILNAEQTAELSITQQTEAQKSAIKAKYAKIETDLRVMTLQNNLSATASAFGAIQGLFKKGSKAQKAAASTQIGIDSISGAIAAFKGVVGIPIVGQILAPLAAAGVLASGAKAIKDVWAVKEDGTQSVGASAPSLPPDLTSKMASPLTNSVQTMQSTGGSNAITSGAANSAIPAAFDYNAMANVMSKLPAPELSIVELRTKERQVDFIDNVSTLKS